MQQNQTDNENKTRTTQKAYQYHTKKTKPSSNRVILIFIGLFTLYVGYSWGAYSHDSSDIKASKSTADFIKSISNPRELFKNTENEDEKIDFDIFWEAWKKVDRNYVEENQLNSQQRLYGAIKGMVKSVGDPYSIFLDPEETNDFKVDMEGNFEGIGAELGMRDGILTIVAPINGMPAEKAGLRAGDKIFKINGEMASDISVDEAVKRIRGPKRTDVTLTIVRNGDSKTQDIVITRDVIELESVIYEKKEDGIAYVRITKFSEDTSREFNREATKILADDTRGMVLDLRNNPGGYLDVSVRIASKFISKGETAVIERGRNGEEKKYETIGGDIFSEIPIVVLINEGSASASEILAGALRDNRGIKLIGEKSYGKGSVQTMENFDDGSSLKITIAKWFTPSGQSIHEVGLEPDNKIEITEEDIKNKNDTQLNSAVEEIKNMME